MTLYVTRDGDVIDQVCRTHYGPRAGALEAVLRENPGLARRGVMLPSGIEIKLPDLPNPGTIPVVRLWD